VVEITATDFRKSKPGRASFGNRKYTAAEMFDLEKTNEERDEMSDEGGAIRSDETPKSTDKVVEPAANLPLNVNGGKSLGSSKMMRKLVRAEDIWTEERVARQVALVTAARENKT